jgi:hypothetical protein
MASCEHLAMTVDSPASGAERGLAVTALVAMASGIVVALAGIASLPLIILIAAASAFLGSIVVFGVITYRHARSSGSSLGSALARSLRTAGKVLVALMP